jgi:hypothetical protein
MNAILFLLIAVVISAVGMLIVWLRNRKPSGWDTGITDFAREMDALAPEEQVEPNRTVRPPRRRSS